MLTLATNRGYRVFETENFTLASEEVDAYQNTIVNKKYNKNQGTY